MANIPQEALRYKLACSINLSATFLAVKFNSHILQVFQLKTGNFLITKKKGACWQSDINCTLEISASVEGSCCLLVL